MIKWTIDLSLVYTVIHLSIPFSYYFRRNNALVGSLFFVGMK